MKQSMSSAAFLVAFFVSAAGAYEYPLQFTPNPGYRNLVVAGYAFNGITVVGNCSYNTVSGTSNSGKGGGNHQVTKNYLNTCTWDLYGNLLSMKPGAPAPPPPLYKSGSKIIYADDGIGDYTGTDSKLPGRGFVNTPGPHYTWLTPNSAAVLHQIVYTLTISLKSDGDTPVTIHQVAASANHSTVTVKSTTCDGEIKVGSTCSVTITLDPTKVTGSGLTASDTLRIDVNSDAGEPHDFIQNLVILLPRKD